MTVNELKVETLKLMFVESGAEYLRPETLTGMLNNENYRFYLSRMTGAINRCLGALEEMRILPQKSITLPREEGDGVKAGPYFVRYHLPTLAPDFLDVALVSAESSRGCFAVSYKTEGQSLLLPPLADGVYTVQYHATLPRVTESDGDKELPVPQRVAECMPWYLKGDLYQDDEPGVAGEARNRFEQEMERFTPACVSTQSAVQDVFHWGNL